MIRLTFLIFILFFLSNCSFSEKSRIWNDKEEKIENQNTKIENMAVIMLFMLFQMYIAFHLT